MFRVGVVGGRGGEKIVANIHITWIVGLIRSQQSILNNLTHKNSFC